MVEEKLKCRADSGMSPLPSPFINTGKVCFKMPDRLLWCQEKTLTFEIESYTFWGFPGGAVVENLPANAVDTGSSPGLGRSHMPRSN